MADVFTGIKKTLVLAPQADGSTDPDSEVVDMTGFNECTFLCAVGTITTTGTVTLKASRSENGTDFTDITGATDVASGSADSDKFLEVHVKGATSPYLRCTVTRATANSVIGGVFALQAGATNLPITPTPTATTGGKAGTPVSKVAAEAMA